MNNKNFNIAPEKAEALKLGDFSVFEDIYKTFYPRLANYVYKMSGNRDLSEDLAQETFYILWTKRHTINTDLSLSSYLFKVCHNEYLQHVRKQSKERAFLDEVKATVYFDTRNEGDYMEKYAKVRTIIDGLSPKCKEVFMASKFDNLSYVEIAERMGISKKTVEVHISKAYSILRKKLNVIKVLLL